MSVMKSLSLFFLAGHALGLSIYTGPVPNLPHKPFGYGGSSTGGSSNSSAVYLVKIHAEFREALAVTGAKTIYVNGVIHGNELPDGTRATCEQYVQKTGSEGAAIRQFNFIDFIKSMNASYTALVDDAVAAGTPFEGKDAVAYRDSTADERMEAYDAALDGINLYLNSVDNIWIRNLRLIPPRDCTPVPEKFPATWNALYDAVGMVTATNVWLDSNVFQDTLSGNWPIPEYLMGWTVGRADGLFDAEDGSDYATFSHNVIKNHGKSLLFGGGQKEADRDLGKMRFTLFGNYFTGSASRNPLARFGTYDITANVFEQINEQGPAFTPSGSLTTQHIVPRDIPAGAQAFSYNIGIYNQSTVIIRDNVFLQTGQYASDTSRIFTITENKLPGRPARVCIPSGQKSTLNGIEVKLPGLVADTLEASVKAGTSVAGGVVVTCSGIKQDHLFPSVSDVLSYVKAEAGQHGGS